MGTARRMFKATALLGCALAIYALGRSGADLGLFSRAAAQGGQADAQPAASPVMALPKRDVYYPGSEDLGPDEMRVVACGTGMPNARPKQAAACWLVELGNGDKFIFDAGLGCAERISAMKIPYDYLDKVFLGHLHADHIGDLDAIWIGGVISNRQRPLRVWGPSGSKSELGTNYMIQRMKEMYSWDMASRQGNVNTQGLEIEVHEFAYHEVNSVIYQENGVTIRTLPAIHAVDGSVSFVLEWNGLKFSFSSDTYPNKWWMEHTKGSDLSVHECFSPPSIMVEKQKFAVLDALNVATQVHTSPAMFGKVMSLTKPRMAVGYHAFIDFDTLPEIRKEVRSTYDGPLEIAVDYMVFNVTKDDIRVRMAAIDEDIWPQPSVTRKVPGDPKERVGFSDFVMGGRVVFKDVIDKYYAETNAAYGTSFEPPK